MDILFFSTKPYDRAVFDKTSATCGLQIRYVSESLGPDTAQFVQHEKVICIFVNDVVDKEVVDQLAEKGVGLIALRCAGYNNVDLESCRKKGVRVVRVPAYSPHAVAEHTLALMLTLNRKIHRAYNRVREGNFSLDGLMGFDFYGRTLGVVGSGRIGAELIKICLAMGMKLKVFDPVKDESLEKAGAEYVTLDEVFASSDVISFHCPLTESTYHLVDDAAINKMKTGVMLINTSRGAVMDACAVLKGLKQKKIAYLGLDVYEQESELFFRDLSCDLILDDVFERLLTFPNVVVTGHQAFFTEDALNNIAVTTLENAEKYLAGNELVNEV